MRHGNVRVQMLETENCIRDLRQQLATAQAENEALRARVAELEQLIKHAQVESGVCMCGDMMEDHNQASGHSPVDIWDHARDKVIESSTSGSWLLRKQAEAVEVLAARLKEAADKAEEGFDDESDTACTLLIAKSVALKEAQRLRTQADESERAGGEK